MNTKLVRDILKLTFIGASTIATVIFIESILEGYELLRPTLTIILILSASFCAGFILYALYDMLTTKE